MAEILSTSKDRNIKFISSNVGGKNDDTQTEFKDQLKIINDNKKDFSKKFNNTETRFGNSNISVDDFYFSNPIIYPQVPDLYFQYIQQKNLKSINTQVITKLETFNIDSYFRLKTDNIVIDFYETLTVEPFTFINNSNLFSIAVSDSSKYNINDNIIIQGFTNYTIPYNKLNIFFENTSNIVKLDIKANFDFYIPLIDVYINITGVNNLNNYFKNIPLSLINQQQKIILTSDNYLSFMLPITFYTDNTTDSTLISSCKIEYLSIGNYPINLINANLPYSKYNLLNYQTIFDIIDNNLIIKLQNDISINNNIELNNSEWKNNKFITGNSSIQIGRIENINIGFVKSSNFIYYLPKIIKNVVSVKMVSSEIPNTYDNIFLNINNTNNKFYWSINVDNNIEPYSISLDYGYYDFDKLKYYIELKTGLVPRNFINNFIDNGIDSNIYYPNNIIKVDFNENLGTSTFSSFTKYILPKCLISLQKISDTTSSYILTIEQQIHNFGVGQIIFIENSLDYQVIPASYINIINGHKIINIINNNRYQIQIDYVNIISENPNTISNGGFAITISTQNSFRLFFDKSDTFGELIGFRNVGNSLAITPYSTIENNYNITNTQLYIYGNLTNDVFNNIVLQTNILSIFRYKYILLTCSELNNCISSNNISYFYKIELDNNNNNNSEIFYNSYVDNPIYFYPCLDKIENLEFKFLDPFGNEVNFYNLDNSFTLVFTCIENYPENTNLNPKVART
jgi:hypothetical protein